MALTFQMQHDIAAPPERVFHALTDLEGARHWMSGLVRLEPLTPGGYGPGFEWREVRRMFGREASEVFRVEAVEPDRSLTLFVDGTKGSSRKGYYRFRYLLAPAPTGTTLTLHGEVGGMGKVGELIGRLFIGTFKKAIARDTEAMKRHVEGSPSQPSGT